MPADKGSRPESDRCKPEPGKQFELTVPADIKAISTVVEWVMKLTRETDCDSGKEFAVETALREALANAIIHGAKNDPTKEIQCCVACDDSGSILLVVRDPGPGFDPAALPSPTQGQNIFNDHGRGIYLINQLMDEVRYERGGSEIRMRKY